MATSRRLPTSTIGIFSALRAAKSRMGVVPPSEMTLRLTTQTEVTNMFNTMSGLISVQINTAYAQAKTSALSETAKEKGRKLISHYFIGYNNAIARGEVEAATRTLYQLAVTDKAVPYLGGVADIIRWGDNIAAGEAARVADGGIPMANPSALQVKNAMADFNIKNLNHGLAKTANSTALQNIEDMKPKALLVVNDAWDDSETFYNYLDFPARREKCREWGVVYLSDVIQLITVTVIDGATAAPIFEANAHCVEGDTTTQTDVAGNAVIKTTVEGHVTITIAAAGYLDNEATVTFIPGTNDYAITVKLTAE